MTFFTNSYYLAPQRTRGKMLYYVINSRLYKRGIRNPVAMGFCASAILRRASCFFPVDREMAEKFVLEYCPNASSRRSGIRGMGWGWMKNGVWTKDPLLMIQEDSDIWNEDIKSCRLNQRPKNHVRISANYYIKHEMGELLNAQRILRKRITEREKAADQGHDTNRLPSR